VSEQHVLFLALGANRRRATVAESARAVAGGDRVTVVVADSAGWGTEKFADGVEVIDIAQLEMRHSWMPAEQLVLFRLPGRGFRLVGRGPLREWSRRAHRGYRRRLADRLHQRTFLPLLRRGRGTFIPNLIRRHLGTTNVDLLVVNDPASMPAAVDLLRSFDGSGPPPHVAYSFDHAQSRGDR
jgi:hypothetical protein